MVATALSIVAARMAGLESTGGIRIETRDLGSRASISITANQLPDEALQEIAEELRLHTGQNPSVAVQATSGMIRLLFAIVKKRR